MRTPAKPARRAAYVDGPSDGTATCSVGSACAPIPQRNGPAVLMPVSSKDGLFGLVRVSGASGPVGEGAACFDGFRVLVAEDALLDREEFGELVAGSGGVPGAAGPAGEIGL